MYFHEKRPAVESRVSTLSTDGWPNVALDWIQLKTREHPFSRCPSHWQHRNEAHTHTAPTKLPFPNPALCSSTQNIPHPASSTPSSPFPITHHPLYLLDLGAHFLRLSWPLRTVRSENALFCSQPATCFITAITTRSHTLPEANMAYVVPQRLPLPSSASVSPPFFPFLSRNESTALSFTALKGPSPAAVISGKATAVN